jgi:phage gp45-like
MIRGIIKTFSGLAAKVARFTASGRLGELIEDRESFQHYGMASRPLAGSECLVLRDGNHFLMIASEDRRYRIALEGGEVALYTDEGDKIHLKRNRKIEVTAGSLIQPGDITIEAKGLGNVKVVANEVTLGKSALLNMASGVVTQQCVCSITAAFHPVVSQTVKATL